jgi:DNA repair protein RAD50
MEMKTNFDEKIAIANQHKGKLEREMVDINTKSKRLKETVDESIWEISKLQAEAEVNEFIHCQYY